MRSVTKANGPIAAAVVGLLLAAVMPAPSAEAVPSGLLADSYRITGEAGDELGTTVAVWGDTAIVGAPGFDDSRGTAYILRRSGHAWLVEDQLTFPLGSAPYDQFGCAVALQGETALVGAIGVDFNGANAGAVYVFVNNWGDWVLQAVLIADNGTAYDWFGGAVALDDGTALIGAPRIDTAVPVQGKAYVFTRSGAIWSQRAELIAPHSVPRDGFGASVALQGGTALIGAPGDIEKGAGAGAAWVFTGSGSDWDPAWKMVAKNGGADDGFGGDVALDRGTALIGAPGDHENGAYAGAAYVFTGLGDDWTERAKIVAYDGGAGDYFGGSVAVSGASAIVGAVTGAGGDGAAYVFTGSGADWVLGRKLLNPEATANGWFGSSVALSGGNAVIGAPFDVDSTGGSLAGSASFYSFRYPLALGVTRIAGANRYQTAVAASKRGFPVGAPAVVVATGENWPDALGGSALAGAAYGPLLLTRKDVMPGEVAIEVQRLGAVKAYVLGSTAAVGPAVEGTLVALLGRSNVVRLGGANRYETALLVAEQTRVLPGFRSQGGVFVATGLNYPDATAAAPLAAWTGMPILLANARDGTVLMPVWVGRAVILGSEAAVPRKVHDYLAARLGAGRVVRLGGANRYETAALIAAGGAQSGMRWDGAGLATGTNFPDALAAGPMLAADDSVLLLTRTAALPAETAAKLHENQAVIDSMFIFGDQNAVSAAAEAQAKAAAGIP